MSHSLSESTQYCGKTLDKSPEYGVVDYRYSSDEDDSKIWCSCPPYESEALHDEAATLSASQALA